MRLNLTTAHISIDKMTVLESNGTDFLLSNEGDLYFDLHMLGMLGGNYSIGLNADAPFLESSSLPVNVNLGFFERDNISINYELKDDIAIGEILTFEVFVSNGLYTDTIELKKTYLGSNLETISLLEENFEETSNWDLDEWGLTQEIFISPPFAMTDSEGSNYQNGSVNYLHYIPEIDLTDQSNASLSFWTRWEIEAEWDYVQISASEDGQNFQPLCGRYTNPGSIYQTEGEPLYDGMQSSWVKEEIDLTDYLGKKIFIRFVLAADQGLSMDGFYFDDFTVNTFKEMEVSSSNEHVLAKEISLVPNPATNNTTIDMPGAVTTMISACQVFDNLGRSIMHVPINAPKVELDLSTLTNGVYFLKFRTEEGESFTKKLIKS